MRQPPSTIGYAASTSHTGRVATSPWEPDGTQPPPPPPVWDDPVTGFVAGGSYQDEPLRINVAKPAAPDLSDEVRRAVDAMLSGEEDLDAPSVPAQRGESVPGPTMTTPGLVPPNPRPGWPRTPSVRQIAGFRPRQIVRPRRIQRVRTRTGGSAIVGVVGVLLTLGVIITIVVAFFVSLMGSISSLFN